MIRILSVDQLAEVAQCSHGMAAGWLLPLDNAMTAFEIDTSARAAAFLAHVLHESAGLTALAENLNYSANRLVAIWPKRFFMPPAVVTGLYNAIEVAHRPEVIANIVYANRLGNGPRESGDGWRYRGRGLIQLTGRDNYARATRDMGVDFLNDPDLLLLPIHAANSAAWYWWTIDGNSLADQNSVSSFEQMTIAIDGGLTGIRERMEIWNRAKSCLDAPE